jgi:GR25 family glycosyltransferase involved in LPS biosynthesis|tara:strand:+ start:854 stop:1513 length:660 start_codon:yes stop_codon:yes gene_type:complete
MSIYDNIDNIYYINLYKSNDRLQHISNHLKKYFKDKNIIRFNAVNNNDVTKYFNNINESKSSYGCYLSHMCILKYLINLKSKNKLKTKYSIVFEDDAEIDNKFINILKNIELSDDFNIILGLNYKKNKYKNYGEFISNHDKDINFIHDGIKCSLYGTSIVLYNNNKLEYIYGKLLENIIKKYKKEIDIYIIHFIKNTFFFNTELLKGNKFSKNSTINLQ